MTEGARSFRRRGTFAHRSPWSLAKSQDVGPAKSGQLNDADATVLHLEVSTRAVFKIANARNRFCIRRTTDIVLGGELQLLDVIVCATQKIAKNKRREGFARSPADGAADGAALSKNLGKHHPGNRMEKFQRRTAGTPARSSFELRANDFRIGNDSRI